MPVSVVIQPGLTEQECKIVASGSETAVLTADDAVAWGLGFSALQGIVARWMKAMGTNLVPRSLTYDLFGNNKLTDFSRCITPYNTLFKPPSGTDELPPMTVTMKPTRARIVSMDTEPTIMNYQVLDATHEPEPTTFRPHISDSTTDTCEVNWNVEHSIGVSLTVGIEVGNDTAGAKAKTETTISMGVSWGEGGSKSHSTEVGSGMELDVTLDPGELAVAALSAYHGTLRAEVDLDVTVEGWFGFNTWAKHHHQFWPGPNSSRMTWAFMDIKALTEYLDMADMLRQDGIQHIDYPFFANGKSGVYTIPDTDPKDIENAVFHSKPIKAEKPWEQQEWGVTW